MPYMDNTGLWVKYGTEQTVATRGGEYVTNAALRQIEFTVDLTQLTETETPLSDIVFFPAGMKIQEVEIYCETAAATGAGIDVGLVRTDRTTEMDFDGIIAAVATASLTVGSKQILTKGSTGVGAYITNGTSTPFVGYVSASRTTATAFTAGLLKIRIRYERP